MLESGKVIGAVDSSAVRLRLRNGHRMIGIVPRSALEQAKSGKALVVVAPVDMSKGVIQLIK